MQDTYDAIVLGLGAMGAAATYQLARRGARVLGLDQYTPPHEFGSSHGETRITRIACGEGADYAAFAQRSHEIWRELEAELGVELLTQNGFLAITGTGERAANHGVSRFLDATVAAAKAAHVPYELLDTAAIRRRFPAFNVADGDAAYHDSVGGFVRPNRRHGHGDDGERHLPGQAADRGGRRVVAAVAGALAQGELQGSAPGA